MVAFSCWALARSLPNGFSTMTRLFFARPAWEMPWAMRPNSGGGTSR